MFPEMHWGKFKLDIGENSFTEGVIKHWNTLAREVMESQSLEVFKQQEDEALHDIIYWTWWYLLEGWICQSWRSFLMVVLMISVFSSFNYSVIQ